MPRFRSLLLLFVLCLPLMYLNAQEAVSDGWKTLTFDAVDRSYYIVTPDDYDEETALPVVIALHPTASSPLAMAAITGLDEAAKEHGFIAVFPKSQLVTWSDGRYESGLIGSGIVPDDVGFLRALIEDVQANYPVDPEQIHITGMAMGGLMAYRAACEMPDVLNSVAVVGALMWSVHANICPKTAEYGVNLLVVHGLKDTYYGRNNAQYPTGDGETTYEVFGVNDTAVFWVNFGGCDSESLDTRENWLTISGCHDGTTFNYFALIGGTQNWPRLNGQTINPYDFDMTDMILDFFTGDPDWGRVIHDTPETQARSYTLYVPDAYDGATAMPLVVALHGRTGTGSGMAITTEFNPIADEAGFIVVYPDGQTRTLADGSFARSGQSIDRLWSYTRDIDVFSYDPEADDTQFLRDLIDDLALDLNIDRDRVYVTGFSNGGFMTFRLACEAQDTFAAFAAVGAAGFVGLDRICADKAPVPIMYIHGTDDISVRWEGIRERVNVEGQGEAEVFSTWPAAQTVGYWATFNDCGASATSEDLPVAPDSTNGTSVTLFHFDQCPENAAVDFYRVNRGGHNWPGVPGVIPEMIAGAVNTDIHASEVIWTFFSQYSLADHRAGE